MAKGKRAVALFEVIHQDKRFGLKSAESPPKASASFSAKMAEEAADLWRKKNSDPETWTFPKERIGKSLVNLGGDFGARVKSTWRAGCTKCSGALRAGMGWLARIHGVATGAMAAGIVIGGVILARHFVSPRLSAGSVEAQIEAGPVHPEVLAVTPRSMQLPQETYSGGTSPELQEDVAQASATASETEGPNLAQPGERVVNMHYVLMQSYFDEKTAEEARDFLNQHGIACTIERGVKGWRPDFYQVIGLQGFPRASGEAYLAYREQVEKLGEEFSPHSKYKRFAPEAIKW